MMKKRLSFLLALVMLFSLLSVSALAENTVLSAQKLTADGKSIECEKYNIDGSNYFKLRDLAYLLNGTASQFSVGWDSESKTVSIVTGEPYEANGSELDLSAGDQSATAVASSQTIMINGVARSDLSVYNIGGSNFFKLRDLGGALGFVVDYDKDTNTAIIKNISEAAPVDEWLLVSDVTYSMGYATTTTYTYDSEGRVLKAETADPSGWSNSATTYTYDDKGQLILEVNESAYYGGQTTYTYDAAGNMLSSIYTSSDGSSTTSSTNTYDAAGNLLTNDYAYEYTYIDYYSAEGGTTVISGSSRSVYTYDANGNVLTEDYYDGADDDTPAHSDYTYDANGNLISEVYKSDTYSFTDEYTYDADGNITSNSFESYDAAEDSSYSTTTTYTYDNNGNTIKEEYSDGSTINYIYSADGILVSTVVTDIDGAEVYRSECDENGNEVYSCYGAEDYMSESFTSYDALGNILSYYSVTSYGTNATFYSYDYVNGTYSTYNTATYNFDMSSFFGM